MVGGRMTRQDLLGSLRERLGWPDLDETTVLKGNERWDSLAQVDVVMLVQEELGETLSAEAVQRVTTAEDLLALVDEQVAEAKRP
jgi:acyl carrier protein